MQPELHRELPRVTEGHCKNLGFISLLGKQASSPKYLRVVIQKLVIDKLMR